MFDLLNCPWPLTLDVVVVSDFEVTCKLRVEITSQFSEIPVLTNHLIGRFLLTLQAQEKLSRFAVENALLFFKGHALKSVWNFFHVFEIDIDSIEPNWLN